MADRTSFHDSACSLSRRDLLWAGLATAGAGILDAPAHAQGKKEAVDIPEPEVVSLTTKDGVQLKATFYAPAKRDKKVVPILMVHGWDGQQDEYKAMAMTLQRPDRGGHAILTVDLRGHGLSTRQKLPDGEKDLQREKLRAPDIEKMVLDLEACKKFLVEKNNAGELNVSALCLVAAEFGCIIALKWAVLDWNARPLPGFKQGQDVQAIALLSPEESFKGVTARTAISNPLLRGKPISKLICVGQGNSKSLQDARSIHKAWERFHGKPPADEEADAKQDLFFRPVDTELQGTQLLDRAFSTPRDLVDFINRRLVARMDSFPWQERKNPLGGN